MAGQVDKRIIQMQFENKQFEKNIAKSQKSVEDLKQAMNFEQTSKGLNKFADGLKNLDLSGLTNNIQKLADKFTGLGTVSELVISQVRRKIEEAARSVSGFINSMTTQQISAGMDKYEMLNKSVQTIKAATGRDEADVYKVLDRLNEYTDQTSYNFSDMAQNIGKFTSVGISLESAEKQMEGIANWAARSGAGINEASRAMYNLSQAMGVGKMTLIDWKSIENAGMATKEFKEQMIQAGLAAGTLEKDTNGAIKTAKSLGKQVEVTYQNVGSTLNKGWATSNVISNTLEKYYYDDLYYEKEQEAILKLDDTQKKSFDEMIASGEKLDAMEWKHLESTGVITEDTKNKILELAVSQGKLTKETDKDGKKIYKTVNKTGKQIEFTIDNIEESFKAGWFDKGFGESVTSINDLAKASYEAAQKCLTFTDVLGAWKDQISTGWMTSFKYIFGNLSESMEFFSNICNRVGDAIGELIDFRNSILASWSSQGGRNSLIDLILGDYGKDEATGAYGFLDMLDGVKNLVRQGLIDFLSLFGDDVDKMMMKKNPEYLSAFLGKQLKGITDGIGNFMKGIRDFFNAEVEYDGKTKTRLEVIGDIVKGISGALKLGLDLLGGVVEFIGMIGSDLTPGLDSLLEFFGDLGVSIFNTADEVGKENKIHNFFVDLRETVKPLTDSINALLISISDLLYTIFGLGDEGATQTEALSKIGDIIKTVASIITKVASPIITFISRIIDLISNLVKEGINGDSLKEFGAGLGNAFGEMMTSFADALPEKLSFISDWIHGIFGGAKGDAEKESKSLFSTIFGVRDEANKVEKDAKKNDGKEGGAGILGLFTGSNIAVWLGVASLVSVIMLIRKAKKTVGAIGEFFGGLGDSLKNGFKVKFNDESFATKFIKICTGIALVAASIFALGSMPLNSLIQGGIAVLVVVGIMFGLYKLLEKSAAKGDFKNQMAFSAQVASMAFAMAALAIAVGILTISLIPFTLMSWDQYARAMAGLGGVLLEMVGFMALIKLLKLDKSSIVGFAGFAIGLGLLVRGILPFANMTWDQYARVMAGLGGVLLEILAFMELFKVLGLSTKAMKFDGIAKFAIAIAILVFAIKPFANMTWDQYARVMAGLGGVLLEILAFMELFKLLGLSTLALNFKGIIKFAVALAILIFAIKPFANMSWEQYAKVMAGLGGVLIEILAFMELFKLLGLSTLALNFKGIMKFVLAITILILAIQPFANMTWDQYARVMAGLGGVLLEILAFMELFKLLGLSTKALDFAGILMFTISLWILINAIMPFKDLNWEQYARTMAGLGGVLVLIAGFMWLLKKIDSPTLQIAAFMGFAYGIGALINAVMPFANMEWHQFAMVMIGLVATMGILIGFMALVKRMNPDIGKMLKLAVFAAIFAAVSAIFAVVLTIVKDVDWKVIAAFTAGLTLLLVGIGLAAAIANVIGVKGFLILAIGVALIFGALALVLPLLIGGVMGALRNAAGDFAIIADLMSTFSNKMSGVGEDGFDKAGRLFTKMGELIGQLAGFMFNGWSTAQFMDAMAMLVLSADELMKLDSKLKSLSDDGGATKAIGIVTLYEGLLEEHLSKFSGYTGYSNSFYTVMFNLGSAFDYFESMTKNMGSPEDNQGLQLIKQLAGCASDLDTIYKMDLGKFRDQLAELGGAMIIYAQGAAAVEGKEITADTDIGGAIIVLQKISESLSQAGGFSIPSNMPKDDELTAFGVQLAALAGALVAFEQAGAVLGDGTEQALKTLEFFKDLKAQLLTMDLGKDLSESIDSLKGEDGVMIQADELTTFGEDIAKLGSAMSKFAESTQVVDEQTGEVKPIDFTKATEALDSIAGLNEKLPDLGGVLEVITGRKQTLEDLATQVELLGTAMGEFYTSTSTTDGKAPAPMDFSKSIDFLNSIGDLQTKLPTVKSFSLQSLFEDKQMTLGELASQLVQLGSGLGQLSERLSGKDESGNPLFDPATLTSAANVLTDSIVPFMNAVSKQLPHVGGLVNIWDTLWYGRESTLSDIGTQLGGLGEGLGEFGQKITGKFPKDTSEITIAVSAIDSIIGLLMRLGDADNKLYAGSIADYAHNMNMFLQAFMNGTKIEGDENDFYSGLEAIVEIMQYVSDALNDTSGISVENLQMFELLTRALQNLASIDLTNTADFENVGLSIITGMANGITNNITIITVAAENAAIAAYNAAMAKLKANSPSKVFMDVGSYIGLGMARGINDSAGDVVDAATGMSEGAIDSANNIVGIISRIMAEGSLDTQPTIAPVLDLTNLNTGMAAFGESLNGYSVGLDTSIAAARAAQAGATQYAEEVSGPDYSGIYERMSQLGEQISGMNKAVSQMRIYLDTGALVGGVSDQIDMDIGRKTFYASRNN